MKYPSGKNVIGYSLKAAGNRFFFGINPGLEQEIPNQFAQATPQEVNEACELAKKAFASYAQLPLSNRMTFIKAIVTEIEIRQKQLCELMTLETGLPLDRAQTELKRSIYQFESYAELLVDNQLAQLKVQPADPSNPFQQFELRKFNVPIGLVVVFGASNFPFAYSTLGGDVASALVAGCPVIVKAHPLHPNTAALSAECIVEAARKANMPDGVFSQLNAIDFEVGEALLKHDFIAGVGFTGSISGGKALLNLSNARRIPIPVYAEMGSVNPVVVLKDALDADVMAIAEKLAASISLNAGQFCTSPGVLLIEESENSEVFVKKLTEVLSATPIQTMLGKNILQNYEKRRNEIEQSFPLALKGKISSNGIEPSLVVVKANDFIVNEVLREEVFGAFACVVMTKNVEEIIACLNELEGQLTGSIFTNNQADFEKIAQGLQNKVGRIIVNGVPTGVQVSSSQQHGGPFPSSSSSITSVGSDAVYRWLRPVAIQNFPGESN